jgi:hypothetical protein
MINISKDNCYNMILEDMEEKIIKGKSLCEKKDYGFVGIFWTRTEDNDRYSDVEDFLMNMGVDISKVEGNLPKVFKETLDKVSEEVDGFIRKNYDIEGYKVHLGVVKIFADMDIVITLKKI